MISRQKFLLLSLDCTFTTRSYIINFIQSHVFWEGNAKRWPQTWLPKTLTAYRIMVFVCKCMCLFHDKVLRWGTLAVGVPYTKYLPQLPPLCFRSYHCRSHDFFWRIPSLFRYYATTGPAAWPSHVCIIYDNNIMFRDYCVYHLSIYIY